MSVTLILGELTHLKEHLDLIDLSLSLFKVFLLLLGNDHIRNGDGDRSDRRIVVAHCLKVVKYNGSLRCAVALDALIDDLAQSALTGEGNDLILKRVLQYLVDLCL